MGILNNNPMMAGASGKVGPVYFRTVRGKLIVCNMPPKGRKFTAAQLENQKRFGRNSKIVKQLLADPKEKAAYQSRVDNEKFSAHMVALSDKLKAPRVEEVDVSSYEGKAGDEVVIKAPLMVEKVEVTVVSESGEEVEAGEAVRDTGSRLVWRYVATADNPEAKSSVVKVVVFDARGRSGILEQRIQMDFSSI